MDTKNISWRITFNGVMFKGHSVYTLNRFLYEQTYYDYFTWSDRIFKVSHPDNFELDYKSAPDASILNR